MRKILSKLLAVSLVLTATPVVPGMEINADAADGADITTGLIGYYGFEDSLANEASKTGGSATLHGGAGDTWNLPASGSAVYADSNAGLGKAYQFSGDTGVAEDDNFARGEGLQLDTKVTGTEYTISFWVNPEDYGAATTSLVFANHGDDSCFTINSLNGFRCSALLGKLWDWDNRGSSFVCLDGDKDGDKATVGNWTMVTVTCKSGEQKLYFNGVEQASAGSSNANVIETFKDQDIFLGINWWDASFKGLMDEVYIYNRALSAEDVAELHTTGKIPTDQIPEPGETDEPSGTDEPSETDTPPITDPTPTPGVTDGDIETLTGTAWWTGNQFGKDYSLKSDGTLDLYVGYISGDAGGYGAFGVELQSASQNIRKFITTGSDKNAWQAIQVDEVAGDNLPKATGEFTGIASTFSSDILQGHQYKISIKREGNDFSIVYYDLTADKEYWSVSVNNACWEEKAGNTGNLGMYDDVNVHIIAQVGTYKVSTSKLSMEGVTITTPKPLASYPIIMPTPEPTPVPTPAPTLPPADDENSEGIELDCTGWWTAHTSGMEVTESGIAITFNNNTYSSASEVWNIPVVVAYSGDEPVVNGAGYDEYVVIRGDGYAWTMKGTDANTGAGLASWNGLGYTYEGNTPGDSWVSDNKSGTSCKVQAVKSDGKVIIETTVGSVTSKTSFPVEAGKKVYISLSGEQCKLTNIKPAGYTGISGVTVQPSATPEPGTEPTADPSATAEPGNTQAPGTTDPGTTPGNNDPGTTDPGTNNPVEDPSDNDNNEEKETKKTMKVSGITAKAGKKKVTGTLSVKGTKVTVKVGSKKYKNAKVNGKKFTFTASSKFKKGTKITVKVTKSGYKTVTKTVKVK